MCKTTDEEKKCCEDERKVWETMMPLAWHKSVADETSIFCETYKLTRRQIVEAANSQGYDVIIEVGCGTGDVIGELDTTIPCYGLGKRRTTCHTATVVPSVGRRGLGDPSPPEKIRHFPVRSSLSFPCFYVRKTFGSSDINPQFIEFCNENHPHDHCEFLVQDACSLTDWWKSFEGKYRKPLVICVNNTLNIMPVEIRGDVLAQMLAVAGKKGYVQY